MNLRSEITWLTVVSTVTLLLGIAFVLFFGPALTAVGIVLVTVSGIVLVVDVVDIVGHWRQVSDE